MRWRQARAQAGVGAESEVVAVQPTAGESRSVFSRYLPMHSRRCLHSAALTASRVRVGGDEAKLNVCPLPLRPASQRLFLSLSERGREGVMLFEPLPPSPPPAQSSCSLSSLCKLCFSI